MIVILVLVLFLIYWISRGVEHGPVFYEKKNIYSLSSINPQSILFVHIKSPLPERVTIGVTGKGGIPLSYPLYDDEIVRRDNEILVAISPHPIIIGNIHMKKCFEKLIHNTILYFFFVS